MRFVGINVCEMDAFKRGAIPVVADARAAIDEIALALKGFRTSAEYQENVNPLRRDMERGGRRVYGSAARSPSRRPRSSARSMRSLGPKDVIVGAAGSLPGDLHKLWRAREPNTYHLEYGYSCMGYEIAGGLGVKMADPSRDVYVMLGDGSYLMMAQEIVTSIQEGHKLVILLLDSSGYASIGGLSRSIGSGGFGTGFDTRCRSIWRPTPRRLARWSTAPPIAPRSMPRCSRRVLPIEPP